MWRGVPRGGAGKRGLPASGPDTPPPVTSQERAEDEAAWKLIRSATGSAPAGRSTTGPQDAP
eukprot:456165-Alexandrium_andersonii.AAC.1